jgi:hypothetical protein
MVDVTLIHILIIEASNVFNFLISSFKNLKKGERDQTYNLAMTLVVSLQMPSLQDTKATNFLETPK